VGLGHVSPSRADSVPDQPIPNENGRIQLIASGQFHDVELLRRKLESCGHQFQTQSDSEIVVHLYEQYGANCLQHLRGEFVFILYDRTNQSLLAAGDWHGAKRLCYAVCDSALFVASATSTLLGADAPSRWEMNGHSLLGRVQRLALGHYLWATSSHVRILRYDEPDRVEQFPPSPPSIGDSRAGFWPRS
jgi:asparagine synthase (glutamine-hydrolysing)